MNWTAELLHFAVAAAAALAVFWVVRTPAVRSRIAGFAAALGRLSTPKVLLLVIGLTLVTRGALLPTFKPIFKADTREYVEKAAAIADEGHPRSQEIYPDGTHFYRTLGYSLPLAAWFKVTGTRGLRSAQWFNVLTACVTAWLILLLGRVIRRETAGRLAALGYALYLPLLMFSLIPYTETWTTLLMVLVAVLYERLRISDSSGAAKLLAGGVLGVVIGLLVITRTEFVWLPLLAAGLLLVTARGGPRGTWPAATALVLASLLPFVVNHTMRAGYPGFLRTSVQGGLILYFGNNPIGVTGHGNATPDAAIEVRRLYRIDPTGGLARDKAIEFMKENPLQVLLNMPKKAYHVWLAKPQGFRWHAAMGLPEGLPREASRVMRWIAWSQSLFLLVLGVTGLRRLRPEYRFWVAVMLVHLAMWLWLAASSRNRFPLEPWLMLAGCVWLLEVRPPKPDTAEAHAGSTPPELQSR